MANSSVETFKQKVSEYDYIRFAVCDTLADPDAKLFQREMLQN